MSTVQNVTQWERFPGHFTEHYIEESVAVYLERDPNGDNKWVIDPSTIDGCQLDSTADDYPMNSNCECGDQEACDEARYEMQKQPLPSGEQLLAMLADALGYRLVKKPEVQ